eukprot:scaffold317128_cov32-Tisochrysis_lutea.AAC.2
MQTWSKSSEGLHLVAPKSAADLPSAFANLAWHATAIAPELASDRMALIRMEDIFSYEIRPLESDAGAAPVEAVAPVRMSPGLRL